MLPLTVTIFVDPQELQPELRAFRAGLWRSLGLAGLILVLAQMLLLTLGLRPLRRITQDISGIESGKLRRLEGSYPKELESLRRNLNHLLETEDANQTRYRNALDSLAHSLKTPLSVIRSSLPLDPSSKSVAVENAIAISAKVMAMPMEPNHNIGLRPTRSTMLMAKMHAAILTAPDITLISSESASENPTACHRTAP